MSKTTEISIRCLHCRRWFPSPIFFGDSESLDTSTLFGNIAQCHHCGQMTGCNKENFRARFEDGGFLGVDTGEDAPPAPFVQRANVTKQGRNELCACGSGKKFKRCHGAVV